MDRVSLVGLRFYAHIREVLCALARTQIECYICMYSNTPAFGKPYYETQQSKKTKKTFSLLS